MTAAMVVWHRQAQKARIKSAEAFLKKVRSGMKDEVIKTFSYRISQANKSELVVITYDICSEYLQEAAECAGAGDYDGMTAALKRGKNAIDLLIDSLDMEQEGSRQLLELYLFYNKTITKIRCRYRMADEAQKKEYDTTLERIRNMIAQLRESFKQVSLEDSSKPLMANTQKVYAGLTYSGSSLNEVINDNVNRGFLV
jgi:flagellar protein FliS